jgi:hypothetical protein
MLWTCRRCSTRFAVGLPFCPQCTSTDIEKEDGVPKITTHGGPSNQDEPVPAEPAPPAAAEAPADGLDALTVVELRERLRDLDQPTTGNKLELLERLRRV